MAKPLTPRELDALYKRERARMWARKAAQASDHQGSDYEPF